MQNLFGSMAVKHLHRRDRGTVQDTGEEKQVEQSEQLKKKSQKKSQTHRREVTQGVENNWTQKPKQQKSNINTNFILESRLKFR